MIMIIAGSAGACVICVLCIGCCLYRQIKLNNDKVSKVISLKETENTVVKLDPSMKGPGITTGAPVNIINRDDKTIDSD